MGDPGTTEGLEGGEAPFHPKRTQADTGVLSPRAYSFLDRFAQLPGANWGAV